MSSKKKSAITVEPLDLRKKVKKKASREDRVFRRTVRSDHGYPLITLPKFFLELGLKLDSEVIVEKRSKGSNPLNWEIVITKPRVQKTHLEEAKQ